MREIQIYTEYMLMPVTSAIFFILDKLHIISIIILLLYLTIYIVYVIYAIKGLLMDSILSCACILLFTYAPICILGVILLLDTFIINVALVFLIPILWILYAIFYKKSITLYDILDILNYMLIAMVPIVSILYFQESYFNDFSIEKSSSSGINKEFKTLYRRFGLPDRETQISLDIQLEETGYTGNNRIALEAEVARFDAVDFDYDTFNRINFNQRKISKLVMAWNDNAQYLDILRNRDPYLLSPTNLDSHRYLSARQNVIEGYISQLLPESNFNSREDFIKLRNICINFNNDLVNHIPDLSIESTQWATDRYIYRVLNFNTNNEHIYQGINIEYDRIIREYKLIPIQINYVLISAVIILAITIAIGIDIVPQADVNPHIF